MEDIDPPLIAPQVFRTVVDRVIDLCTMAFQSFAEQGSVVIVTFVVRIKTSLILRRF